MKRKLRWLLFNAAGLVLLYYCKDSELSRQLLKFIIVVHLGTISLVSVVSMVFLSWIKEDPEQLKDETVINAAVNTRPTFGRAVELLYDVVFVAGTYFYVGSLWANLIAASFILTALTNEINYEISTMCKEAAEG